MSQRPYMSPEEVRRRNAARQARIKARKRKNRIALIRLLLIVAVLIGACIFLFSFFINGVYRRVHLEAGDVTVEPADFQKNPSLSLSFAKGYDASTVNTHVPGEYDLKLKSGLFTYGVTVIVKDTVAPVAEPVSRMLQSGARVEPMELVQHIQDATAVTASFSKEPDFSGLGRREAQILLTDLGGNTTLITSELFMIPTRDSLFLEVDSPAPKEEDFFLPDYHASAEGQSRIELLTDLSAIPMDTPGAYEVKFRQGSYEFSSTVYVMDYEPPVFTVQDVTLFSPTSIDIQAFIVSVTDRTPVTFTFVNEPDLTKFGEQEVVIRGTDTSGNSTEKTATLLITDDTEPPQLFGVFDFKAYKGSPISYLANVTATDNSGKVEIKVNADGVDPSVEGTYPVVYTAIDSAGNQTVATCTVTIIPRLFKEEDIKELAQEVIREQLSDDMTDYEKLEALYYWIRWNVHYVEMDIKDDYLEAAYYGLKEHRGDCFVFFATAKVLLTEAGFKNKDIDTLPLRDVHYWNLVDLGDGWMHFDTVPREDGVAVFLYIDDETLQKYSERHQNSHIYDKSRFPDIVFHQEHYPEGWVDYTEELFPEGEDYDPSSSESSEQETGE